jgi:hypothetical protein
MTDAVVISLIAAAASTLSSILATVAVIFGARNASKLTEVHSLVDGRMSQVDEKLDRSNDALRVLTEKSSIARGVLEEKERGEAENGKREP